MKIFFIARGWPSKADPQWGCFERDQAIALSKLGHQIVVLSVDSRFRRFFRKYGMSKFEEDGIVAYNLYAGFVWGRLLRNISPIFQTKVIQRFLLFLFEKVVSKEGMPDIVYGHYLEGCACALTIKKKYGVPAVGIEHWSKMGCNPIKAGFVKLALLVYPNLDRQLVVSSFLKENILRNTGLDTVVISNMISDSFYYKPKINNDSVVRFVSSGNLFPIKGFDFLITAFQKANLPFKSWNLSILGGGPEYNHLNELIAKYGFKEHVFLLGRKDREDVVKILNISNVYIMSSRSETFGVAAVEALACGLPVIATECGGSADFMNIENGLTCPVDDTEKMSESIRYMFEHWMDYNRTKIATETQKKFSSEAIAKKLEGIFKEVIDNKHGETIE